MDSTPYLAAFYQIAAVAERAKVEIELEDYPDDKHLEPVVYRKRIKIAGYGFKVSSLRKVGIINATTKRLYAQTPRLSGVETFEDEYPGLAFPVNITEPRVRLARSFFIPLTVYEAEFPDGRARIPLTPLENLGRRAPRIDWELYAEAEGLRQCLLSLYAAKRKTAA